MTVGRASLACLMNQTDETKPKLPEGGRVLDVGEIIQDGDLHWNSTVKHWVAVTPQGEETVAPEQEGFYCRKNGES